MGSFLFALVCFSVFNQSDFALLILTNQVSLFKKVFGFVVLLHVRNVFYVKFDLL